MIEKFKIKVNRKNVGKLLNIVELFEKTKEKNLEILKSVSNFVHNYQKDNFLNFVEENNGCVVVLFVENSERKDFNLNFEENKFQKFFSELVLYQIKNNVSPINVYYSENNNFIKNCKKNLLNIGEPLLREEVNFFHLPDEFYSIDDKILSYHHRSSFFIDFIGGSLKYLKQQNFFHEEKLPYENFFVLKSRNLGMINYFSGYTDNLIPVSFFEHVPNRDLVLHFLFFYVYLISSVVYNIEDETFLNAIDHYLKNIKKMELLARSMGIITVY